MSFHDQNEGGWVTNILLTSFNGSLACKRMTYNNLNYHRQDTSKFLRSRYVNSWQCGPLVSHVPASRATSASAQGAHHIPHQTSGRGRHCSRHIFSLQQAMSPVRMFSMRIIYQNHHPLKNTKQTPPPPPRCPGLTLNFTNQNSERDPRMSIF